MAKGTCNTKHVKLIERRDENYFDYIKDELNKELGGEKIKEVFSIKFIN